MADDKISIDGFDYQKIHGDNDCYHCDLNLKCKILGKVLSECEKDPKKRDFVFQRVKETEPDDVDWTPLIDALLALRGELVKGNQPENEVESVPSGPVTAKTLWTVTDEPIKTDEDLAREEVNRFWNRKNRSPLQNSITTNELKPLKNEPNWSIESENAIIAAAIDRLAEKLGDKLDQIHADLERLIAKRPLNPTDPHFWEVK